MADAFKCDRCEDFSEGRPERLAIRKYAEGKGFMEWANGEHLLSVELCEDCLEALTPTIRDYLDGDGSE